MNDRIFVFKRPIEATKGSTRPGLYAVPESKIETIESQLGSENVYLKINGIKVEGSFNEFVGILGRRVDIK